MVVNLRFNLLRYRRLICKISNNQFSLGKNMKVLTQKLNPTTGKIEWEMQDENYDYNQEVARSAYADMLHDTERNKKYYEGIRKAIALMKERKKPTRVLDIGTGTGLLAMMAASCGADEVTACEAFQPMAECAEKIIAENGYADKIKLIPKRSTEIIVGPGGDMPTKANILVTEVFDTELIGEGAISTFRHAHEHLLEADSLVVPSKATIYAQVVESDMVWRWNRLHPINTLDCDIIPPTEVVECDGAAAVHDIQLSQLPAEYFKAVSKPLPVLRFDFNDKSLLPKEEHNVSEIEALQNAICQAVFMWWDLEMDQEGEIVISCAPFWAHPDGNKAQWRDHWMQAVYFLPEPVPVEKDQTVFLHSYHDEYSLWFCMFAENSENTPSRNRPICRCGLHAFYSRSRIGMLNDVDRHQKYMSSLKKIITPETVCLSVSDGSLLPLIAAKLGAKKVIAVESQLLPSKVIQAYVEHNNLKDVVTVLTKRIEDLKKEDLHSWQVNLLIGEPFFHTTLLPWHNLYLWYLRNHLQEHNIISNIKIFPSKAVLKGIAVEFLDLWKIRAPLGSVEGFQLTSFDSLIEQATELSDAVVEPQPLWEYPCSAQSEPITLLEFNFTESVPSRPVEVSGEQLITGNGHCNGIALWIDWILDSNNIISTGPVADVQINKPIKWDIFSRQGVYFFRSSRQETETKQTLHYHVEFNPKSGNIEFSFHLKNCIITTIL